MHPMRPMHVRNAAFAFAGIGALAAFAALPPTAGAATTTSAQAEYQAALKAAGTQGVHFASSATQGGVSHRGRRRHRVPPPARRR